MDQEDHDRITHVAQLCREAADKLGDAGSFRLRVLLQMLLADAEKNVAAKPDVRGGAESRRA